jgi:hypothetical protein
MLEGMSDPGALRPAYIPPPRDPDAAGQLPLEPDRRSAIPKVVGILATVFCGFGLLFSAGLALGMEDEMLQHGVSRPDLGSFATWMMVSLVLAVGVFALHLTAGIQAIRYARSAPRLMTAYAVAAIALAIGDAAISAITFPSELAGGAYEDLAVPRFGLAFLALPWPIVALVLINTRGARTACAAAR